jgi:long-chain acyl-CoA synthetase
MVVESVVVQREDKLVALVYPDFDEAKNIGFSREDLQNIMEQNKTEINASMPAYSKITAMVIQDEEFEKTPKKSIKRYLYK